MQPNIANPTKFTKRNLIYKTQLNLTYKMIQTDLLNQTLPYQTRYFKPNLSTFQTYQTKPYKDIEHLEKEARTTVRNLEGFLRNLDDTKDFKRNTEELMEETQDRGQTKEFGSETYRREQNSRKRKTPRRHITKVKNTEVDRGNTKKSRG